MIVRIGELFVFFSLVSSTSPFLRAKAWGEMIVYGRREGVLLLQQIGFGLGEGRACLRFWKFLLRPSPRINVFMWIYRIFPFLVLIRFFSNFFKIGAKAFFCCVWSFFLPLLAGTTDGNQNEFFIFVTSSCFFFVLRIKDMINRIVCVRTNSSFEFKEFRI